MLDLSAWMAIALQFVRICAPVEGKTIARATPTAWLVRQISNLVDHESHCHAQIVWPDEHRQHAFPETQVHESDGK